MLQTLRTYLKHRTPAPLRRLLLFLCHCLLSSSPAAAAAAMNSSSERRRLADLPPFDPLAPARPVSFPVRTLEDLESRSYFRSFHYPFNRAKVPLQGGAKLPERERILVCHDMAGGYLDDRWVQGGRNAEAYAIWHWHLIHIFVYFSHNLVTLPPPGWTNASHAHGVKVLGTFIAEWDEGKIVCDKLLSSNESARMYAERLTELAVSLGFDGWLLNIEVKLDIGQIPNLKEFISRLTDNMHSAVPGSLVIWYDAVTIDGQLNWQNQLNGRNKPFFDICDGIFINYSWQKQYPKQSATVAGDRKFDVYMGIDVFGRRTYGGGQWKTNIALDVLKKDNVSAAIFAPGWIYETKQPPDFQTAQNRWWSLVEESWGIQQVYPKALPFYSNFDQGHGYHFSVEGEQLSEAPWCNLAAQGLQPFLKFSHESSAHDIQVLVDFKEASYSGGGSITFKGTLVYGANFTTRLFQGELLGGELPVHFRYSVKTKWNSMLGILLELSSASEGKLSIFLASSNSILLTMNQFASKFSKVIVPQEIAKVEASPGWMIMESSVDMKGYTLTAIHAVCYKLQPEKSSGSENISAGNRTEYYAVLGHLGIKMQGQNFEFPPASLWLIEGQHVKRTSGLGSKSLAIKLAWKLKAGNISQFPKYNIYLQKLAKHEAGHSSGTFEGAVPEFLGVAHVEAFYISDLVVPSGTYILKFTIQVCGVDGATQKLNESPSLQLLAEGY